jgi:predicted pyridoxine 5'-phosphate oxidase superfamily flavin-nucleotide-binding protein
MVNLTQEMKDLIAAQQCFVATVNPDGTPSIGPKRSTRVLDDEPLAYNQVTGKRTWGNAQNGSIGAIKEEKMEEEKRKPFDEYLDNVR